MWRVVVVRVVVLVQDAFCTQSAVQHIAVRINARSSIESSHTKILTKRTEIFLAEETGVEKMGLTFWPRPSAG
jgi:hypothetical protein